MLYVNFIKNKIDLSSDLSNEQTLFILSDIFSILNEEQKNNFKYHLKKNTGIICGKDSLWFCYKGKACPSVLANNRIIPRLNLMNEVLVNPLFQEWKQTAEDFEKKDIRFLECLVASNEEIIREAMVLSCFG